MCLCSISPRKNTIALRHLSGVDTFQVQMTTRQVQAVSQDCHPQSIMLL